MSATAIEWCDDTRNWQAGCTEARRADGTMDPACVNCYARLMSARLGAMGHSLYQDVAERAGGGAKWTGRIRGDEDLMRRHMAALRPGKVTFVGSMTDLFHEDVPEEALSAWADAARSVSARPSAQRPRGMVTLTKRADRLYEFQRRYFPDGLPSWWWPGVTVADQRGATERLPALGAMRAHGPKVVSYEPAMGPVRWLDWLTQERASFGWLIAGGESGAKARPSHPDWFRGARLAAKAAGIPYFFKQWGEWCPNPSGVDIGDHQFPDGTSMVRVGKKAAGRLLDGREWSEVPGGQ